MHIGNKLAEKIKIRKGDSIKCSEGCIWLTAGGDDFIISRGENLTWTGSSAAAVIGTLLCRDAEVIFERRDTIFR